MPFDPTLPADNALVSSSEMRTQLTGLRDLIDSIPQGEPGPEGPAGADGSEGPPGQEGLQGADGSPGMDGSEGSPGMDGSEGSPGMDGSEGSPGMDGSEGSPGMDGSEGSPGPEGPPGEVSQDTLDSAIADTSANSNAVSELSLTVSDPPTQGEVQSIADKLDELINALRRV